MPSFVSTSSRMAWGTRPSMMCAFCAPPLSARSADSTFGSMPPSITLFLIRRSASRLVSVEMCLPSPLLMPCTSVRWISFSAKSAAATSPATRSALMLYVSPVAPTPTGAITGINPPSSSTRMGSGLPASTSPTSPMSAMLPSACRCSRLRARTSEPSLPLSPTARPPWRLIRPTISLLILPTSTISTISMVSASVTRIPPTKCGSLPSRFMRAPIWGPPPWTMTGRMPTSLNRSTSLANCSLRSACSMAAPPYLMTRVLPWKARMYGSASSSTSARWTIACVSVSTLSLRPALLKDEAREVLVLEDGGQVGAHVVRVDLDLLAAHLGRGEGDLLEQLLHDRVEPPRPDVLGALVDRGGDLGHLLDGVLRERERHALGLQQLHVLADEGVLRFAQNADKILPRQGLELDPDGEAALQLRDQVRRLGHVEGSGGDEQDVVRPDHAVLGRHRRALDDGQEVTLDPLPGDVGPVSALPPGDLVELVEEDDP